MADDLKMRATLINGWSDPLRKLARDLGVVSNDAAPKMKQGFSGVHMVVRDLGNELSRNTIPGLNKLSGTAGLAGIAVGGLITATTLGVRRLSEFSERMVDLKYSSKEIGVTIRELKALKTLGESKLISPDETEAGLRTFKRNMEDFKNRIGSLRNDLRSFGAGDVVDGIRKSATTIDALRVAFDRMQELMKRSPDLAARFAEAMFGSAKFARMGFDDLVKAMGRTRDVSQKTIEDAEKFHDTWIEIKKTFTSFDDEISAGMLPGFQQFLDAIKSIPPDDLKAVASGIGAIAGGIGSLSATITGAIAQDVRDINKLIDTFKTMKEWADKNLMGGSDSGKGPMGLRDFFGLNGQGSGGPTSSNPRTQSYNREQEKLQRELEKTTDNFKKMNFAMEFGGGNSQGGGIINASFGGGGGRRGGFVPDFGNVPNMGRGGGVGDMSAVPSTAGAPVKGPLAGRISIAKAAAIDELRKRGVPEANLPYAASILTGQAIAESNLNPDAKHDGGTGYGIYGARDPGGRGKQRRSEMLKWLKANGYKPNDLAGQMRYMAVEAMTDPSYKASRNALLNARPENMFQGADILTRNFERPAVANSAYRHQQALRALNVREAVDSAMIDKANGNTLTANGTVKINVHAPKGTRTEATSDGLFKNTEISRYPQMQQSDVASEMGRSE